MYNIINWLMDTANAKREAFGEAEVNTHLVALRELGNRGRNMSPREFREVLTTSHFSDYFSDALSRAFLDDYEYQVGEWPAYCRADTAPDFRAIKRFRMSMPGTLYLRQEKGEAEATSIDDTYYDMEVEEYARQIEKGDQVYASEIMYDMIKLENGLLYRLERALKRENPNILA